MPDKPGLKNALDPLGCLPLLDILFVCGGEAINGHLIVDPRNVDDGSGPIDGKQTTLDTPSGRFGPSPWSEAHHGGCSRGCRFGSHIARLPGDDDLADVGGWVVVEHRQATAAAQANGLALENGGAGGVDAAVRLDGAHGIDRCGVHLRSGGHVLAWPHDCADRTGLRSFSWNGNETSKVS